MLQQTQGYATITPPSPLWFNRRSMRGGGCSSRIAGRWSALVTFRMEPILMILRMSELGSASTMPFEKEKGGAGLHPSPEHLHRWPFTQTGNSYIGKGNVDQS